MFDIWCITLISAFTAINLTTLSLRKSSIIIALQAALSYVRYTLPFITPGLLSCASSLYFQSSSNYRLCKRELLLHQQTPLLQKHGAYWVYYFPQERTVTIRCFEPTRQLTRTVSLHGPGLLHTVMSCHISSSELRSLPDLRGSTQTELGSPNFYLPSRIPTIIDHEAQQLEAIVPADTKKLDYITSHVLAQKQTYDVDSLFHLHRTAMQHEGQLQWYTTPTTSINVAIFLGLFSFLIYIHFQKLRCYFFRTPSDHNAPRQTPNSPTPGTQQNTNEQRDPNAEREVVFNAYSMQPTQGCS